MSEEQTEEQTEELETNKKVTINLTFIIVAIIIAFTYIYVENGKIAYQEKTKAEKEIEQRHQKTEYENCIANADLDYVQIWNKNCKKFNKKNDCSLPAYNANSIDKMYSEAKKECMDKLKNNAF